MHATVQLLTLRPTQFLVAGALLLSALLTSPTPARAADCCCAPCELAVVLAPLLPRGAMPASSHPCFVEPVTEPPSFTCCQTALTVLGELPEGHPCQEILRGSSGDRCGGPESLDCEGGLVCIDVPGDSCNLECGDVDCFGTCVAVPDPLTFCDGFAGLECPEGMTCVDDPSDGCSLDCGAADCINICVVEPCPAVTPPLAAAVPPGDRTRESPRRMPRASGRVH